MSHDVNDLLQRTADTPTRPLDTAAVVGQARRQTRLARAGAGLGAVAVVAVVSLVALPMVTGDDPGLEIADAPDPAHGEDEVEADDDAATPSSGLWGQTFASVAVTGGGAARALVDGTQVRLTFETGAPIRDVPGSEGGSESRVNPAADGFLTWDAGCNFGLSQVRVQDGRLTLDGYGEHTLKLCGGAQGEQDVWLNDFLRASPRWALEGDQLVLSANETRIVLEIDDQPDQTNNTSEPAERAPVAGSDASHWPVELRYVRRGDERSLLRFRGTSWEDWSVEVREPDGSWRLVDREHPGEEFETEGGAFLDEGATADRDGFTRAPGPELIAGWRDTTGLGERVVVGLGEIPGADDLVERLGLDADEVEAYVSPNIRGCDLRLTDCIPDGETGARGVAHLSTGFPLYAEEGAAGETAVVWLEAQAIRWADPTITPVPVENIPRR